MRRIYFYHEMNSGKVFVLCRQSKMRAFRPAHQKCIVTAKGEHPAFMRARDYAECYFHGTDDQG